jgi:hypothetical protein
MNDIAQPGTKFHINFNDQLCCSIHDKNNLNLYDREKNPEIKKNHLLYLQIITNTRNKSMHLHVKY